MKLLKNENLSKINGGTQYQTVYSDDSHDNKYDRDGSSFIIQAAQSVCEPKPIGSFPLRMVDLR